VQCLELAAGAVNLTLMIMYLRDGLGITGKQGQDKVISMSIPAMPLLWQYAVFCNTTFY